MSITVQRVSPDARAVVERLVQLYEYEFSGHFGSDIGDDGLYHTMNLDAIWQDPFRVFLMRVDGHLAGFALVTRHPAYVEPGEAWLMNEFFVLRKYQRQGVGEQAAGLVFDQFPGRWEVAEQAENSGAQAFWRVVIERYTGGRWGEAALDSARWHGPVQSFTATARAVPLVR
jgi:predicted acetyltransferase